MSKQFVQTKNESDDPMEWLGTSLIFAKSLGSLLKEGEGVCVTPENEMKKFTTEPTLIVYKEGGQVKVVEHFQELQDGKKVWMHS